MSITATRDRLVDALRPMIEGAGLDLEDVEVTPIGRRRVVRVVVDKDGGVTLDDISDTTQLVSRRLDDSPDLTGEGSYTLEVTSPGTDRPLTRPRHWHRNLGRLVEVSTHDREPVVGRVVEAGQSAVRLDVEGAHRDVAYTDVVKAHVRLEFKPPRAGNADSAAEAESPGAPGPTGADGEEG